MEADELKEHVIYNLDDNQDLINAIRRSEFIFCDTSVFTRKEWNTYWRILKIQCSKEDYSYLVDNQDLIFEIADQVHGKSDDYYLKEIEFVKIKPSNSSLQENTNILFINEKLEINKEKQLIGQGGFSTVYKVKDKFLENMIYAYKVLDPSPFNHSSYEVDIKRFIREANFLFSFSHENIVKIYSVGEVKPQGMYIKMEYIDGWKLKDYISNYGPLSLDLKINLCKQIIDGMGYSHSKGILHRDLAERNIMVTKDNIIKILDFGLAKIPGENSDLTTLSTTINTDYIAPEVKDDYTKHTIQSDIYSIGCIIYRIFTNKTISTNYEEVLNEDEIPLNIQKVIKKCVNNNLESRYKNCGEILYDLEENISNPKNIKEIKEFSLDKFKELINSGISEIVVDDYPELKVYTDLMETRIQDIINSNKFVTAIPIVNLVKVIPHLSIQYYKNITITIAELIEMKDFYENLDSNNKNYFCKNLKEIINSKMVYNEELPF